MAKRKNPLKDLNAFLKQEAKSFVTPDKVDATASKAAEPAIAQPPAPALISHEQVVDYIAKLPKDEFFALIQEALEQKPISTARDKMLINTLLYLKDQTNWKENIKAYWS